MAWGKKSHGVDDLLVQLRRNCTAETMCVMRSRKFDAAEVKLFSEALGPNTSLKSLLLAGHPLSPQAAASLSTALGVNGTLQRLTLGDASFGDQGLSAFLANGLERNASLTSLDLEFRGLGPSSAKCLGDFLAAAGGRQQEQQQQPGPPPLEELLLARNTLASSAPEFAALLKSVRSHSHLAALDLSSNGVPSYVEEKEEGSEEAASASASAPVEGAAAVAVEIAEHLALLNGQPTLRELLLHDNAFGPSAGPILATLLNGVGLPSLKVMREERGEIPTKKRSTPLRS